MQRLHVNSYLQFQLSCKDILNFLLAAIFKSRLLKMAATVKIVDFCTSHHNSSLEENSELSLLKCFDRYKSSTKIDIVTYQVGKIKAYTSLCLFVDEILTHQCVTCDIWFTISMFQQQHEY